MLSVPYALHAKTSETIAGGFEETDPSVPEGTSAGEMQYWDGSEWVTVPPGSEGQFLSFSDGAPVCVTLADVSVVAPTDVYNPATGKIWMDHNLGASQVATAGDDANAYGDLYQWGRLPDGHEKRTSGTTSSLSSSDIPGHDNFILTSSDWRSPQTTIYGKGYPELIIHARKVTDCPQRLNGNPNAKVGPVTMQPVLLPPRLNCRLPATATSMVRSAVLAQSASIGQAPWMTPNRGACTSTAAMPAYTPTAVEAGPLFVALRIDSPCETLNKVQEKCLVHFTE